MRRRLQNVLHAGVAFPPPPVPLHSGDIHLISQPSPKSAERHGRGHRKMQGGAPIPKKTATANLFLLVNHTVPRAAHATCAWSRRSGAPPTSPPPPPAAPPSLPPPVWDPHIVSVGTHARVWRFRLWAEPAFRCAWRFHPVRSQTAPFYFEALVGALLLR